MKINLPIVLMLPVFVMLLSGCIEKIGEAMLMARGPERMDVLTSQVEKEPLSKRYEYLATSEDYEMALAAVWSFWDNTPVNDAKAVEMLMKNLERWRNPATPKMRKTMKKARGYGNFYSLLSDTISSLRYIYEFTESQEVKKKAKDAFHDYRDKSPSDVSKSIERDWNITGSMIQRDYGNKNQK